ncbi:hypothetical protein BDGGKGIB_03820 [Nodularia sphaerocarpa UHCC 0038]|nr:site-specific integrase [Nodularia sphaerocarpa CS-585]ULP74157.1 hypothetical protein BDGGKGIB_03820 [Nodularia sphaerocarpa UHCC 0038]
MIDQRIREANGRLRANNWGISIERVGDRLSLRGIMPPKPHSKQGKHHQQRISIAPANAEGVKLAESEAKKLAIRLDAKTFTWDDYIKTDQPPVLIGEWLLKFEADYFNRRQRNFKSESTWRKDYIEVFQHLPRSEVLTADLLQKIVLTSKPDTRTRKRFCLILGVLAKFANLEGFDPRNYSGNYTPKSRKPRDLPNDFMIADWYFNIKNHKWRWIYGMLATYGLRNHEVFFLDLEQLRAGNQVISVLQGKTGYRQIWPYHPEWFTMFDLKSVKIPDINLSRSNSAIGNTVSQHFGRNQKLPFTVYDLRHRWAIRTLEYGLDVSLAAQQMGHSLSVHSNIYHYWISNAVHQRAFDLIMGKSDRPQPPKMNR